MRYYFAKEGIFAIILNGIPRKRTTGVEIFNMSNRVSTGIFAVIDYLNSGENQQEIDKDLKRIIRKAILDDFRKLAKWTDPRKWYELSRNEKLIFVLHRFEQVSFPDIADSLDISVEQVEQSYSATTAFLHG